MRKAGDMPCWLWGIGGLVLGGSIGVVLAGLLHAAKDDDE